MSPQMNTLGIGRKWSCQNLWPLAPCSGPNFPATQGKELFLPNGMSCTRNWVANPSSNPLHILSPMIPQKRETAFVFVVHFIEGLIRGLCWWRSPKILYRKCYYIPKLKSIGEVHIKKLTVFWFCLMVVFLTHMKKQKILHLKHRILILHYPNLSDVLYVR